jgi:hypothetical protein
MENELWDNAAQSVRHFAEAKFFEPVVSRFHRNPAAARNKNGACNQSVRHKHDDGLRARLFQSHPASVTFSQQREGIIQSKKAGTFQSRLWP